MVRAAAVLLGVALGACGIDPRSDDFRCGNGQGGCPQGRDCVDGWCVADPGTDGGSCPAVCSRCVSDTCIIECDAPGECDDRVICPPGLDCDVRCEFAGSCGEGVQCSTGSCVISCDGAGSCDGALDCDDACSCATTCDGPGSCSGTTTCPGPGACTQGGRCTDVPNQCDRC
jgi:hypothetical protein